MRTCPPDILKKLGEDIKKAEESPMLSNIEQYKLREMYYYLQRDDYRNARKTQIHFPQVHKWLSDEVFRDITQVRLDEKKPGPRLGHGELKSSVTLPTYSERTSRTLLRSSWLVQGRVKFGSYMALEEMELNSRLSLYGLLQSASPWPMKFLAPTTWHITTCFSEGVKLPDQAKAECRQEPTWVTLQELHTWEDHKGRTMLVGLIAPGICDELNAKWRDLGANHTYNPYSAHISLAYGADDLAKTEEGKAKLEALNAMISSKPVNLCFLREKMEPLE